LEIDKELVYTLEHQLNTSKVEEHLYKDTQKFPKLEPGIKQRTWEVRTLIPPISHIPSFVWINKITSHLTNSGRPLHLTPYKTRGNKSDEDTTRSIG
jgi:hypothetical protein